MLRGYHLPMSETTLYIRVRYLPRLMRDYVKPHRVLIFWATLLMAIAAGCTAGHAWMLQPVLDKVFLETNRSLLLWLPLAVVVIALVKGAATYGQSVIMKSIGQKASMRMQVDLFQHILDVDLAQFAANASGTFISRFTNDITILRRNLTNVLTGLVKESLTLIGLLGVMIYQSWELSVIALLVFPIAVLPVLKLGRRMRKNSKQTQEEMGQLTAQLDDVFQGIRVVKAYGQEQAEMERAEGTLSKLLKLYLKAVRIESAASPMMEALAGIAIGAIIWFGGSQVLAGETTPGAFFSFIGALIMAYKPAKSLAGINTNLQESMAVVERFYDTMDKFPMICDAEDAVELTLPKEQAEITFDDVHFHYRDGDEKALNGLSFTVKAGQSVALVGMSGAGKSTVMNLLLRYYDPQEGSVRINHLALPQMTIASLRSNLALVNQEATLFDTSIADNIRYGRPDAGMDEIRQAAKDAAALEFIESLPKGFETEVGQHGLNLSGGQRQRIAIARAMLRDAPILLLDEATSALDSVSEQQVQEALKRLMQGRTSLVIAHRLSTIRHADQIIVMQDGVAIERGSHEELLAQQGVYQQLYETQFQAA